MSSNLSNSSLFTENQQIPTEKKSIVKHREKENLMEFSIFNKILAHKIHQAPTEFFLRHRASECLWLLDLAELGQKSLLRKESPTLAEREKVYHYENFINTGKIMFK